MNSNGLKLNSAFLPSRFARYEPNFQKYPQHELTHAGVFSEDWLGASKT